MAGATPEMDLEVRARLAAELERMNAAEPYEALGVPATATGADVRARFLLVAKTYHPSRFARLSKDTLKVANEVFLVIREVYDKLRVETPDSPSGRVQSRGSTRTRAAAPSSSRVRRASLGAQRYRSENPISTRAPAVDASSSKTPSSRRTPSARTVTASGRTVSGRTASRRAPAGARPASVRRPAAKLAQGTTQKPAVTGKRPRPASVQDLAAALKGTERKRNEQYETALRMLAAGMTGEARGEFQKLAVADPREKKYRIQFHYTSALEHEEAGRLDDARAEFQRVINIDETFKRAFEGLDRLPKPKKKGRLSKFFGKE